MYLENEHMHKIIFNSSESYDVLEGDGVRLPTFTIEPGQTAHLILTHSPRHSPHFTVHRRAATVCASACPEKGGTEVTKQVAAVTPKESHAMISMPGTYYPHSLEASWMQDPCNPVILEVIIG